MPEHSPAPTPSRAVYGFVMYLSFEIFFITYLIWAIVPEEYLELVGVTFLPQRYWAVAIPVYFLIVLTSYAFFIYPSLGFCMTPNVDDLKTITDQIGSKRRLTGLHVEMCDTVVTNCSCEDKEKCYKEYYISIQSTIVNKSIPSLRDIPMWEVSENLFVK